MGIFSRLSDIINANLNSLLEKAEDPEKIVRLMIQEMEDTLVDVRSSAAKIIADKKERQRHIERLREQQQEWERKAELALRKDREDLAKAALVEKARVADEIEALNKEMVTLDERLGKLNEDIGKLQAKLNDAKARQRSLVARHKTAQSQLRARSKLYDRQVDDALSRFESAERRIDSVESEAEAYDLGHSAGLSEQFQDLEANERVDEELAQLKQRVGKGSDSGHSDNA